VHCDKTVDRIWMQFGMVGRMGLGMRQVVGFGDRFIEIGKIWGANVGCPIVTSWEFAV